MILVFLFFLFISAISIYSWTKVMFYGKEIAQLKSTINDLKEHIKINDLQGTDKTQRTVSEIPEIVPEIVPATPFINQNGTIPLQTTTGKVEPPKARVYYDATKGKPKEKVERQKPQSTMENWIGKNVLAIAASILIFIGLVFLGILTYQKIDELGKLILLYMVSFAITVTGILLNRKLQNVFTQVLSGCGYGCIFISILLTHVWFHKINDITAFVLLLIWIVIALYTAKKMNSLILSMVAHLGMIISIFMAYERGITDGKILTVFIYQLASVVIIVVGNILCFKKTYRVALLLSMLMMLIGGGYLWEYVGIDNLSTSIIVLFLVEFAAVTLLSILLEFATAVSFKYDKLIQIFNKLIWAASLFIMIYNMLNEIEQLPLIAVTFICIGIVFVHIAYSAVITQRFNFSVKLEVINVIILTVLANLYLFGLEISNLFLIEFVNLFGGNEVIFKPEIPMMFLVAFFLYGVFWYTKRNVYLISAYITLILDGFIMCILGYDKLNEFGSVVLSLVYLVIFNGSIVFEAMRLIRNKSTKHLNQFKIFGYLFTEISIISILENSYIDNKWIITLIILVILNIILYILKYDGLKYGKSIKIIMKVNEFLILNISYITLAFLTENALIYVLKWILILLCVGLIVVRIMENIAKDSHAVEQLWSGLKITLLILATVHANTDLLDYAYMFSIICMVTSLASIVLGFAVKAKALRLYGLGTTLLCVLKMVTVDASGLNTITRVIAFIGGGVICFVISAVYNKINKNEEVQ